MLGQFALAEGKKGGQFYTPKSIVSLIVQMLEPLKGRVYDPVMAPVDSLCNRNALFQSTKHKEVRVSR